MSSNENRKIAEIPAIPLAVSNKKIKGTRWLLY